MNFNDWVNLGEAILLVYFAYQQNRIFRRQNEIFAAQGGQATMPSGATRHFPLLKQSIKRNWPTLMMGLVLLAICFDIYDRHHDSVRVLISHGGKELNGQTIDTGGRADVLNGLIVPSFQITATKTTPPLSVRMYLSEGDGRWNGPWEPTESDEKVFPGAFHWGGPSVNPNETWNTPEFIVQRSKAIPFSRVVSARMKVFFGATKPVVADFWLRNNS